MKTLKQFKLTTQQAVSYQQRWQRVEALQIQELQAMPASLKFKQLCFLMNSFRAVSSDRIREKEDSKIMQRWATLRKSYKNGNS